MAKQKNFVTEEYPINSTHNFPYPTNGREQCAAQVKQFIVAKENVVGIKVQFGDGRTHCYSWIDLNWQRSIAGNGANSPTLSEVQVS